MTGYAILGLIFILPLFLGLVWRVSVSHLFFSVMAGELLARFLGPELEVLLESIFHEPAIAVWAEPVVQLVPLVLTTYFLKMSISKGKALLHIVPLLITGIVLTIFMLTMLPETLLTQIEATDIGAYLLHVDSIVVGVVVFVQLLALWFLNKDEHESKFKK